VAGYTQRWFTTHPSINWARHKAATLIEANAFTTMPHHHRY